MRIKQRNIKGVFEIELERYEDYRGFFMRTYDDKIFKQYNINKLWVQENHSFSKTKGVVRGFHFQFPPDAEAKIVRVVSGKIYMIFLDLRKKSLTFGKWDIIILSEYNNKMLYAPRGIALAMCTLTDNCTILYKMDNYYAPKSQGVIKWNDPDLGIKWPVKDPILSSRDLKAQSFDEFKKKYGGLKV